MMKGDAEERAVEVGRYIVQHNTTVRATAAGTAAFGTGKNVRDAEKAAAKELLERMKKGE